MKKAYLVVALLAALSTVSHAGDDALFDEQDEEEQRPLKISVFVYPFVEHLRWMEFFGGNQILEEEGELYGAGTMVSFESGPALYRLRGEYFGGKIDAEGMSGLGFVQQTEATYYGFELQADGAWRFPLGHRVSLGPLMGIGYRWWRKDYENSPTVMGTLEKWHTFYVKAGALGEWDLGGGVVPYAEAGLKLGVFNNNEVTFNGGRVSLNPGGRLTPYAELGLKASFLRLGAYYERIEFSQSLAEGAIGIPAGWGLVQPEVTANLFGARVGIEF